MDDKAIYIDFLVTFLGGAILPGIITNIIGINIISNIVAGALIASLVTMLLLIKEKWNNEQLLIQASKSTNSLSDNITKTIDSSVRYESINLYAINSRYWVDQIKNRGITAQRCTVLVRGWTEGLCDYQRYRTELSEAINIWKQLVEKGNINQLQIYSYDGAPDQYYAIFNNKYVITGLNNFSTDDSTGQSGDKVPLLLTVEQNGRIVELYNKHFDNYLNRYSSNVLYDSTTNVSRKVLSKESEYRWSF